MAACFEHVEPSRHRALLLLSDGLAGNQQEVVRGAYSVLGAGIPLVGGCAGDGLKMKTTYQLHGDRVYTNAVVGAAISSDAPIGIGVRHGWRKVGEPMVVTRSADNRVYLLDDEPALDVYLKRLDAPPEAREDAASFTRFALTHPLGLDRRAGEEQVRFVAEADFAARSLVCIAEVPQGGITWLMEGDERLGARRLRRRLPRRPRRPRRPTAAWACWPSTASRGAACSGRRGSAARSLGSPSTPRGAPVAGFYTYGEIARTQGISGFHNETLVVLAVS